MSLLRSTHRFVAIAAVLVAGVLAAGTAHAYRFIQNTGVGRTSSGYLVTCSDPGGFTHWNNGTMPWYLNTAKQGAGKQAAVQAAMASWTNLNTAHNLVYSGTTTSGFSTDGRNTLLWARGNGCTGSCLAITALVLASGQVITETDISFNERYNWNTNGADYDVQAVCTHELGHTLGMHHSETTNAVMYAYYSGTSGRTLKTDDINGIQCSANRYPLAAPQQLQGPQIAALAPGQQPGLGLTLKSRPTNDGAILRFSLRQGADVKVQVYDLAGRRLTTLVNGARAAGDHVIAWDGASDAGRVPSGMYFARISAGGEQANTTVILAE